MQKFHTRRFTMFGFFGKRSSNRKQDTPRTTIESLESRQLLHGGMGQPIMGQSLRVIEFADAPTAVQAGLDSLATKSGFSEIADTQKVQLNNVDGIEMYSVILTGTGTKTRISVSDAGGAVSAPTRETSTWATLNGTGEGRDAEAAAAISKIATTLNLTAPIDTTPVHVITGLNGKTVYSVELSDSDATDKFHRHGRRISVDGDGNPVGGGALPFSVFSTAVQTGLNSGAPSGATELESTSTQLVKIQTIDGVTFYSTTFTVDSVKTDVTVDTAGALKSKPSLTDSTFSTLSSTVQTALQKLATDAGYTATIESTQVVKVYAAADGESLYSVTLTLSKTDDNGNTRERKLTITVDGDGNPTILPGSGGGPGAGGLHGPGMGEGPGGHGPGGGPGGMGRGGKH
jgi:hypothetical protein